MDVFYNTDDFIEYTSYIVNECGDIIAKASEVDVDKYLEEHPEWRIRCIETM